MAVSPASPSHLLRSHSSDVSALFFSDDNERLYSGDASGLVVVTSTRSLRPIVTWQAHTDAILGVQEWRSKIVTHARDHKLHIWNRVEDLPESSRVGGGSASASGLPPPTLCYSLDVNALNYCRFSLLPQPDHDDSESALIALPNLVESSEADIWALPTRTRIHASVGTQRTQHIFAPGGREGMRTGLIMSLHIFRASEGAGELRLVCAYEDGSVALRRFVGSGETSIEGRGWEVVWNLKLHNEAIMAMRVSPDNSFALTVSADHLVGRYILSPSPPSPSPSLSPQPDTPSPGTVYRTTHPGNSCLAIRDDGRVCAIGGWDGRVRLYATKNLKPLGTLRYHKEGCGAVEFARSGDTIRGDGEEDEEMTATEREARGRWLAVGSKDHRVSLWALISFDKT